MTEAARVELRRATLEDMEMVFRWRNDPFVVERSSTRLVIGWADHQSWYGRAIDLGEPLIFLVSINGGPIGQVRLERTGHDCTMSVFLLEPHTGRGHGVQAIRAGCAHARQAWMVGRVIACVRDDNAMGASGFVKAGFSACPPAGLCPPRHRCFVFEDWGNA